jgi:hypothetical protein
LEDEELRIYEGWQKILRGVSLLDLWEDRDES